MNFILRLKGGKGSGHKGHKGIPGQAGGSLPGIGAEVRDIKSELVNAQSSRDISRIRGEAQSVLDSVEMEVARDRNINPEKYPDYRSYRDEVIKRLPQGFPTSDGELSEWVNDAKERIRSSISKPRSPEEARIDRILHIRSSTGRATARRRQ